MHGEPLHGHHAEQGVGPLPPATTRWSPSDGPDPGATGQLLAPFRAGAPAEPVAARAVEPVKAAAFAVSAQTGDDELEQPVIAAAVEEMGLIDEPAPEIVRVDEQGGEEPWTLAPAGEQLLDAAPAAGADAREADHAVTTEDVVTAAAEPAVAPWEGLSEADYFSPQPAELDVEALPVDDEPWTLTADAVVEDQVEEPAGEPGAAAPEPAEAAPVLELVDEVEAPGSEVEAPVDEIEAHVPPLDAVPEHQQWDAFGRALKEVVSWEGAPAATSDAPPPWMAPEVLRAESSAEEWETVAGPPSAEPPAEAEVAATAAEPGPLGGGDDAFSGELADRLQALAERLRSQGAGAIADAISSGDRLEASIALFIAGYQVGRGR